MTTTPGTRFSCLLIAACLLSSASCTLKFSGASLSPDMKTVSVQYFPNNAALVQPTLSQSLTEALKERLIGETSLSLVEQNADLRFEGAITNYAVTIQQNETAAMNRLSVTIHVKFINNLDEKLSYESNFMRYEDYASTSDLSAVEDQLIKSINAQLVEDLFNKAVVNW